MDYKREIVDSFHNLKNNLQLMVPDIFQYFMVFAISILYYRYSGLAEVIKVYLDQGVLMNELVLQVLSVNIVKILLSTLVFIISTFVVGATADVVKFDMMKDVIIRKRVSLKKSWKNKNSFFLKIILLKLFVYILAFLLALLAALIGVCFFLLGAGETTVGYVTFFFAVIAFLFFKLSTLFRIPILFLDKDNRPDKAFIKSIKIFFKERWRVISIGIILAFFFILFTILETAFGAVIGLMQNIFATKLSEILGFFLISFIPFLIKLIYRIWSELFVFEDYRSR